MVEQGGKGLSFFVLIQYRVHSQLSVFLPQLLTIIKVQRGKQYELGFQGFSVFLFSFVNSCCPEKTNYRPIRSS